MQTSKEPSSFRDPAGFIFYCNGEVYRAVRHLYATQYDAFISSGLNDVLCQNELLLPFTEVPVPEAMGSDIYKVLKPQKLECIVYPYEWCFSQLKDAAILTLQIHRTALDHGMVLKDASAFNVQFYKGKPRFIDTTSFEVYHEGTPWVAYSQFCRHFLAPLLLMHYNWPDANKLQQLYIDGIPLPLASALLPFKSRFSLNTLSHIHWHAASQKHYEKKQKDVRKVRLSKKNQVVLIESLLAFVKGLKPPRAASQWGEYYNNTNYSETAFTAKEKIIRDFIAPLSLQKVTDFGANDGTFSRIFSRQGITVMSPDIDCNAVESNYLKAKQANDSCLYPLVADITNPSAACGWNNQERSALPERLRCDLALALALTHHLFISHHLSFEQMAAFFSSLSTYLIVEFVPFDDSQIKILVMNRTDNFKNYTPDAFESAFEKYFALQHKEKSGDSERVLYFYKKK